MIHYIENTKLYLKCKNNALNITNDSLNLINFIKDELKRINIFGSVMDIGAGIGTLSFFLNNEINFKKFYLIEFQKEVFEILKENVSENNLDYKLINEDANILKDIRYANKFEFVISNPPFYKINSGFLPKNEIIKISKFEINLKLLDLLDIANNILKKNGHLFLIIPLDRKKEIESDNRFSIINEKIILNSKKNFIIFNLKKIST